VQPEERKEDRKTYESLKERKRGRNDGNGRKQDGKKRKRLPLLVRIREVAGSNFVLETNYTD
jgi:hypothetical protein